MPKSPSKTTSLAILRAKVGLTQKAFADLAGMTAASYQQLELGKFPLSRPAARRIMAATGASATESDGAVDLDGKDWKGRPYSDSSYKEWGALQADILLAADVSKKLSASLTATLVDAAYKGRLCSEALRIVSALADGNRGHELISSYGAVTTIAGNADWFMPALTMAPESPQPSPRRRPSSTRRPA